MPRPKGGVHSLDLRKPWLKVSWGAWEYRFVRVATVLILLRHTLVLILCVRREALFDHMEVRDRPSARCRSSGLELEAA